MPGENMNYGQNNRDKMNPFKLAEIFTTVDQADHIEIKTSWCSVIEWSKKLVKEGKNGFFPGINQQQNQHLAKSGKKDNRE